MLGLMLGRVAIYGPQRGQGSWPRVTRGLCEGLRAVGELAGASETDVLSHTLDDCLPAWHDAPIAIHVGPPAMAMVMQSRGHHRHRLAMIAPNSTWLPQTIFTELERWGAVTGYVVPSAWAEGIMRSYTELPVLVYRHGVPQSFGQSIVEREPGYAVLHMASTHRQRKGTAELISAWCALMRNEALPANSRLRLVCDGPVGHFEETIRAATAGSAAIAATILVGPRLELDDTELDSFYRSHDLVVQPSRAEGFGLVPLEARAAGVPVVMTRDTGHGEHADYPFGHHALTTSRRGVLIVPTGPLGPIDDGPGALAPQLEPTVLATELAGAYRMRELLAQGAKGWAVRVRRAWSWPAVTERFMRQYEEVFSR